MTRTIKKLSRGQLSAVGVIIGLASRAELTFFDEPYLGLDAVARQTFYDRLLEDYAEHPRTVVLSTHLIDEVANLLEHVLVIDDPVKNAEEADSADGREKTALGRRHAATWFAARAAGQLLPIGQAAPPLRPARPAKPDLLPPREVPRTQRIWS